MRVRIKWKSISFQSLNQKEKPFQVCVILNHAPERVLKCCGDDAAGLAFLLHEEHFAIDWQRPVVIGGVALEEVNRIPNLIHSRNQLLLILLALLA